MTERVLCKRTIGMCLLCLTLWPLGLQAGPPDELFKQAEILQKNKNYAQAEQILERVAKEHAKTPEGLKARKELVNLSVLQDKPEKTKTNLRTLLTEHADNERLPHIIHELSEQSSKQGKFSQLKQIYQAQLAEGKLDNQAIHLKLGIVIGMIHDKQDPFVR